MISHTLKSNIKRKQKICTETFKRFHGFNAREAEALKKYYTKRV